MTVYLMNAFSIGLYAFANFIIDGVTPKLDKKTYRDSSTKCNPFIFLLLVLHLALFLGLRMPKVGVDTARYVYIFQHFNLVDFDYEVGYMIFNYLLSLFTDNERVFLLTTALVTIVPVGIMIYKYSDKPFLSWFIYICMYYYSFNFSGIRQSLAASFLVMAFMLIVNKHPVWASVFVVIASSFHTSALIFLLAVFLRNHKWKKIDILIIIFSYIIIFIFRTPLFNLITSIFYEEYQVVETNAYTWMFIHIVLLALLIFLKTYDGENKIVDLTLTLFTVGCAFMLLTSVGTNVLRVANYFNVFIVLLIPNSLKVIENKSRFIVVGIGIVALAYLYYTHLQNNPYSIIKYSYGWF